MSAAVIVAIILLAAALLAGVSVPFAMFGAVIIIVLAGEYDISMLVSYGFSEMGSALLISIPMLLLIGIVLEWCGGAEAIADVAARMTGRNKGGKYFGMTIGSAIFGAVSGTSEETLAGVGPRLLSNMQKDGYPARISASLISSASMMGVLIPPGIVMILYAYVSGQSVLACFLAAVIPAVILLILLSVVSMVMMKRELRLAADGAPEAVGGADEASEPVEVPEPAKEAGGEVEDDEEDDDEDDDEEGSIKEVLLAIIAPVIVLGCSFSGIMTVPEAAALAAVYSLIAGWFLYQILDMEDLKDCLIKAGTKTGSILLTVFSSLVLIRVLAMENVPYTISDGLFSISDSAAVLMIFMMLILVISGVLLGDVGAVLLTTPVMAPVMISMGVNPVHYAAIMGVCLGLGCVIPPLSRLWHAGAEAGKVNPAEMRKPTILLIVFAWLPTLILTAYIPQLSLFLPSLVGLM